THHGGVRTGPAAGGVPGPASGGSSPGGALRSGGPLRGRAGEVLGVPRSAVSESDPARGRQPSRIRQAVEPGRGKVHSVLSVPKVRRSGAEERARGGPAST